MIPPYKLLWIELSVNLVLYWYVTSHFFSNVHKVINVCSGFQLLYYRKSPGILYQFTIPKHMTKAAMEAIIPRLKIENQFNQDVEQPVADSSGQPVYETGYENIPTGSGGYPLPKGYRPKIIPNRRTSAQSPPRYIPFTGGKPELQSLTINGRGQARNLTESQYRLYSSYYGPHNSNQAVSGDYGRRYATYPRSEAQRNSIRQGNSLRYNSVVDNTLPRLSAQNIPDASNYEWRIIGFTECSLTCGRGRHCCEGYFSLASTCTCTVLNYY